MMVLSYKIPQKYKKSDDVVAITCVTLYQALFAIEIPYLLSNLAEILHMGQFQGTDSEFELKSDIRAI